MRKVISTGLLLALLLGTLAFPASAQSNETELGVEVVVADEANFVAPASNISDNVSSFLLNPLASTTVQSLGTSGSVNYSGTIDAGSTAKSTYNYNTNSEKIVVRMKGSESATSITVRLYNATSNSEVASQTVSVGKVLTKSVTFTNLSSANNYYITLTNNDQHSSTISGTFAAK